MGNGGLTGGMGGMGSMGGFDPNAMAMMYQNMLKGSGMGTFSLVLPWSQADQYRWRYGYGWNGWI